MIDEPDLLKRGAYIDVAGRDMNLGGGWESFRVWEVSTYGLTVIWERAMDGRDPEAVLRGDPQKWAVSQDLVFFPWPSIKYIRTSSKPPWDD